MDIVCSLLVFFVLLLFGSVRQTKLEYHQPLSGSYAVAFRTVLLCK